MNKQTIACIVCLLTILSSAGCILNHPEKKIKCTISLYWDEPNGFYSYTLNFSEKVNYKNVRLKITENESGISETLYPNENLQANSSLKPLPYHHYTLTAFIGTKPVGSRIIEPITDFIPELNYTASYNYSSKKIEEKVNHTLHGVLVYTQNGNVLTKRFAGFGIWNEVLVSSVIKHTSLSQLAWKNITYTNGIETSNETCVYANGYTYSEQANTQTNISVYNVGISTNGSWNYLAINSTGWMISGNLSVNVTITRELIGFATQRNWLGIPYDCIVVKDITEMKGYSTEKIGENITYKDYFSRNITKKYIVSSLSFENSTIYYEYNFTETYDNVTTNKTGTYFPKDSPSSKPIGLDGMGNFKFLIPRNFLKGDRIIVPSKFDSNVFLFLEYSSSANKGIQVNGVPKKVDCTNIVGTLYDVKNKQNLGSCSYTISSSYLPGLLIYSQEEITYLGEEIDSTQLLRDIVL